MNEQIPFKNVGKTYGPNPGYIRKLWLADVAQVSHIPDPVYLHGNNSLLVPSRMISFISEIVFYKMNFRNKTCVFEEGLSRDAAGEKFAQSISLSVSQVSLDHTAFLYANSSKRWIAFFQDHLGNARVMGSPALPVQMGYGSVIAADNNHSITLGTESTHPAWFLDAMPELSRVFSPGFSENFG
jgi:hypothetical protein